MIMTGEKNNKLKLGNVISICTTKLMHFALNIVFNKHSTIIWYLKRPSLPFELWTYSNLILSRLSAKKRFYVFGTDDLHTDGFRPAAFIPASLIPSTFRTDVFRTDQLGKGGHSGQKKILCNYFFL